MVKIKFIILSISISLTTAACAQKQVVHHWEYKGKHGPDYWENLNPDFSLCGNGIMQSPINFRKSYKTDLDSIKFTYKETPLKIINNGHTIKVKYKPGSYVTIDEKEYNLLQFHFHHPSEHEVEGKAYDMEMHLVHQNENSELAVIGVFMKKGKHNDTIQTLWNNIPDEIGKEKKSSPIININADVLLPDDKSYYRYYGSLTTPPCSEGVSWNVFKSPMVISEAQVKKFESVIGYNSRPVQPVNKRFILESQ